MELKPGYKQTEVGIIPEEWDVLPLAGLCRAISDGTHFTPRYVNSGIPFYSVENVTADDFVNTKFISAEEHALLIKRCKPERGDILMTRITAGVLGDTKILDWDVNASIYVSLALLKPNDRVLPEYLYRYSRSSAFVRDVEKRGLANATPKKINMRDIGAIPIPVPRVEREQQAIADALADVDALLGALDRLIAKKRDLKQAAMQQLLTGRARLPGFQGEWEVKRLGELAKIQRGASPRPIESPVWFDDSSPIGWVRISDVTRTGMFLLETTQRLSPLGVQHSRPVAAGGLIMSICATVGRPIITKIDVCIHDGFVVFGNLRAVDQRFLYYALKWIEPNWAQHGQTGSQMNLNTGLISGTFVSLPLLPEQTAIAKVLTEMDAELAALEQRREKTRALKQAMMQELLTGRIRLV